MGNKIKTWEEKYQSQTEEKIEILTKRFADVPEGSRLLISNPKKIGSEIKKIRKGKFLTIKELRQKLAKSKNADFTCPVTTGIFTRVIAEREMERITNGFPIDEVIPFWRVIDPASPLAKKLSFGVDFIDKMRKQEIEK
ncbi:hypothetical protein [Leptospira sp. GIMC2001]|uniref:hypothetical protein n=1 Tax=Leptospira sp. GIMC2001 TaxID=1513297 RepID=UPI00234B6921|nr:hypothetical protein [Leptospira sp. GIMC2001]WCL47601.1 hypothetical protein O4O04_01140 [Leptospira sp. GIMC2001]